MRKILTATFVAVIALISSSSAEAHRVGVYVGPGGWSVAVPPYFYGGGVYPYYGPYFSDGTPYYGGYGYYRRPRYYRHHYRGPRYHHRGHRWHRRRH